MTWLVEFATDRNVIATLLAAALGFSSVVVTLVLQHRANVLRDQIRLDQHRNGIAAAFAVEVRAIVAYAEESVRDLSGSQKPSDIVPAQYPFVLFEALKSDLHALSPRQIETVVACSVWLPEISRRLRILAGGYSDASGADVMLLTQYVPIYEHLMNHLRKLASEALVELTAAS